MRKTFITGATGFLGRNFLDKLFETTDDEFHLLVRSQAAQDAIRSRYNGQGASRFVFIEGDITQPCFGVSGADMERLRGCDHMWHLAASTSFDKSKEAEIFKANVDGAKELVDLARKTDTQHLHYVSTAYIAGMNKGPIPEDGIPERQGFKNVYEESKYVAEEHVRAAGLPLSVYRPSIIIGDSKTGDSQGETRMIYGYLLGIYTAICKVMGGADKFHEAWVNNERPDVSIRVKGTPVSTKNYMCVDDVANMLAQISQRADPGKTYHLTNPAVITGQDTMDALCEALRVEGLSPGGVDFGDMNRGEKLASRLTRAFLPYCIYKDPQWDTSNTDAHLNGYKKIQMTPERFTIALCRFVETEIIRKHAVCS